MANEFVKGYSNGQLVGFFRAISAELGRRGVNPQTLLNLIIQDQRETARTMVESSLSRPLTPK